MFKYTQELLKSIGVDKPIDQIEEYKYDIDAFSLAPVFLKETGYQIVKLNK